MDEKCQLFSEHVWTLYKLCRPLISAAVREMSIASRNKLRFTSLLGPIFMDFGNPNGIPNLFARLFFSALFFNAFEHRILMDFWKLRIRKITIFPGENYDFCKMGVLDQGAKIA